MFESFFQSLVRVSSLTGILIGILLAMKSNLLKRYSIKWRYLVWLILTVRLLFPFQILIPNYDISPFDMMSSQSEMDFEESLVISQKQTIQSTETLINDKISEPIKIVEKKSLLSWNMTQAYLINIWLIGGIILLARELFRYYLFKKSCERWSKWVASLDDKEVFRLLLEELHIKDTIQLRISRKVDTPLLIGFYKPTIYIPDLAYEKQGLYLILKHELMHYKYKDLWYKLALLLIKGMHWFNPFVHLMIRQANEDLEMLCDERVLRECSIIDKKYYMEMILQTIHLSKCSEVKLSTQFKGGKKMLKERFSTILNPSKKKKGIVAFAVILSTVLVGTLLGTNHQEDMRVASNEVKEINEELQVLNIAGYEIKLPSKWEMREENNGTYGFYTEGKKVGGSKLIQEHLSLEQLEQVFGLGQETKATQEIALAPDGLSLLEITYKEKQTSEFKQYVFMDLPNPPPYAYTLYFDISYLGQERVDTILKSFQLPIIASNPPKKNRPMYLIEEAIKEATYKIQKEDGSIQVVNLEKLDNFINKQEKGQPVELNVLNYIEVNGMPTIKDWYYIQYDGENAYLYGYYRQKDGSYSYDDMPIIFTKIQKKIYEEEGIISYRIGTSSDEATMKFMSFPLNKKLESQLKELRALNSCIVGEWVYYITLGDEAGIHKMRQDGSQKELISDLSAVAYLNGSTAISSEYKEGIILYTFEQLKEVGEDSTVSEALEKQYYEFNIEDETLKRVDKK